VAWYRSSGKNAFRRRDSRLYIQPQKKYADIVVRFSRGSLYYRTRDLAHLDARLFQAKHAPKIDLTGVLDVSQDGCRPALRFVKGTYAGAKGDVLEIDGTISHKKACELEDCIWLNHVMSARRRMERGEYLMRP
jgi:phosphoribulokinase